jgi:pimeloyl-ACP methyl ester carboxylesterase
MDARRGEDVDAGSEFTLIIDRIDPEHAVVRDREASVLQTHQSDTLVLWTSHDPTASPEEGLRIAERIGGARYEVMNGCGHWPQFEDAERFNRIHLDFLLDRA